MADIKDLLDAELPSWIPEGAFINGERWLTPYVPTETSPGQTTYYFARRFQLHGGVYTLKYYVDDAATLWVGKTFDSQAMTGAFSIGDGAATKELYLPSGLQRLDFIVQNLPAGPNPTGITFSLWLDGRMVYSTSSGAGWKWSTAPIPDEALEPPGDPRRLMPVLTITPNWKEGIIERLEWLTDVLASESGAEQRRALRADPRRTFEASFLRQGPLRAMLDSFLTGVGQDEFLLPLWHEAIKMIDGIDESANGVDFISGMGSEREWMKGDLALVINGDPNHYDVLVVGVVNEDGMIWETPPERTWPPGTKIYPLRKARITESSAMENRSEDVGELQVRFTMSDSFRVAEDWYATINGVPLFPFLPNRADSMKADYMREVSVLDNQTGLPTYTDLSEHTAVTYNFPLTLFGRRSVMRLRSFLQAARGRARSFMMPTFMADLVPFHDRIDPTNVLMVKPMGIGQYHRGAQSTRRAIVITFAGQDLPGLFRNVIGVEKQYVDQYGLDTNYETDTWYDRLMLDAPMPFLTLSQIGRISFISESRFAMDSFELQHRTNNSAGVRTSVSIRQLRNRRMRDNSYPPSPDFPTVELEPTGIIVAQQAEVSDLNREAEIADAMYSLRSDGLIEVRALSTELIDVRGPWLSVLTEASRYEVRATRVLGTAPLRYGALGEWQRLGTTRGWALRSDSLAGDGARGVVLALEFRDVATATVRGGYNVTLNVDSKPKQT